MIPVGKTKNGYSKASKVLTPEEFGRVLEFAKEKQSELTGQMRSGDAAASPYNMGKQTGCEHCEYRNICGFDEQIPGCEYRKLKKYSREEVLEKIAEKEKAGE